MYGLPIRKLCWTRRELSRRERDAYTGEHLFSAQEGLVRFAPFHSSGALVLYIELGDRSAPGVEDLDTLVRALKVPHDAIGRMAAALARETLWWHWTARDKNTGQRIAELLGVKEPANIPRPDLIDKLCELVSGMRLEEDGIILETRDGESMRLFDKPEIQL